MSDSMGTSGPVIALLNAFSPSAIYELSFEIAGFVFFLSVIILVIASKIRVIQNTAESIETGGSWEKMLADILAYSALLTLYIVVIWMVILSINAITSFADSVGSIETVTRRMEILFEAGKANQADDGWLMSMGVGITEAVGWAFFYFSLLLLTITMLVMRFAQAMILGLSFIWGEIAIPLSVVSGYKPLKGWMQWLLIGAFWPFVEAVIMVFIAGSFFGASHLIIESGTSFATTDLYFLFTAINGLLWASIIAAPFITASLVRGDGSIAGTVMPFATAAGGIASAAAAKSIMGTKMGASLLGKGGRLLGKSESAQMALGNLANAMGMGSSAKHMANIRAQHASPSPTVSGNSAVSDKAAPSSDAAASASNSSRMSRAATLSSQLDSSSPIDEPPEQNKNRSVKRSSSQQQVRRGVMINKKLQKGSKRS